MWMMKRVLTKKGYENLTEEDKMFVDLYGKKISFVEKENIDEIVKEAKL